MAERYRVESLRAFAAELLARAGLDFSLVSATAEILVEGDMLGHDTHGLAADAKPDAIMPA
jgi:LDH2 family malate/lactate/ureidoglycolate dehydrogenase